MILNPAKMPANLDYTDKDFDSIRRRLINLTGSVFPEWEISALGDWSAILLEMNAFVLDIVCGYLDFSTMEGRLATTTQRIEAIRILELIGYEMAGQTSATVDVQVSITSGLLQASVRIPAGTKVRNKDTSNRIEYQTLADVVFTAGGDAIKMVSVENSSVQQEVFTPDGTPEQTYMLSKYPYLDEGDDSVIGINIEGNWAIKDSLLNSGANDRHVMIRVDQYDRATLYFGDGINGAVPVSPITLAYKYGGGATGRVSAGSLIVIDGVFKDVNGNLVTFGVTNPAGSTGGDNRETVNSAKQLGPASLRATERTVTTEDFAIRAIQGGADRAMMLTSDEDLSVPENVGQLYMVSSTSDTISSAIKLAITALYTVDYPKITTFSVQLIDAPTKAVNVGATVHFNDGYDKTTVRNSILENLGVYMSPINADGTSNSNVDFGYNMRNDEGLHPVLAFSDIYNIVRDTIGVRKISPNVGDFTLNDVQADVVLLNNQFPVLGTVVIVDGDTGSTV